MTGTLYVVATPLGNLGDLSPRAAEVLRRVPVVAAEDTRRTRGLLSHLGARPPCSATTPIRRSAGSTPARDSARRPRRRAGVRRGHPGRERSRGGPGGGGPGRRHHRRAHPGALGGGDGAVGRRPPARPVPLPRVRSPKGRRAGPAAGPCGCGGVERRVVRGAHPARRRCCRILARLAGPERRAVVARELTKLHEELRGGTLAELADYYSEHRAPRGDHRRARGHRRAGPEPPDRTEEAVEHAAELLAEGLSPSRGGPPPDRVALGLSRNDAYRLVMELP